MTGRAGLRLALPMLAVLAGLAPGIAQAAAKSRPAAAETKISASMTMAISFATLDAGVRCPDKPGGSTAQYLYLAVKNDGTEPVTATQATLLAPADLQICPGETGTGARKLADQQLPLAIGPGRTAVVPLPIGTVGTPRPGTVPLVVELRIDAKGTKGQPLSDTIIASDKVELAVPGLSDTLKLFGAPTLFLLPGVIVLGAIGIFFQAKDEKWLDATSASFWIVSILISLGIASAYGIIATLSGSVHNLVDRYDLRDVGIIWAVSVLSGGLVGNILRARAKARAVAAANVEAARLATAAAQTALRTPQQSDTPHQLLARLAALGMTIINRFCESGNARGFLLSGTGLEERWLMPQMTHIQNKPATASSAEWNAAREALERWGGLDVLDPQQLIEDLAKPLYAPLLPLRWESGHQPYALAVTDTITVKGGYPFTVIH